MDKTDSRIKNETRRVRLLDKKSTSCGECSATVALVLCTRHQEPDNNKPVHHSDLWPSISLSVPFSSLLRLEQSSELKGLKPTACKWQSQNCTLWSVSVLWALTGPSACDLWVCYWNGSKGEIRQRHLERSFTQIFWKVLQDIILHLYTSEYFLLGSNFVFVRDNTPKNHYLISLMLFQTCITDFLLWNTNGEFLKNIQYLNYVFRTTFELSKWWQKFNLWLNYSFNCIFCDVINDYSLSDFSSFVHANHVWST